MKQLRSIITIVLILLFAGSAMSESIKQPFKEIFPNIGRYDIVNDVKRPLFDSMVSVSDNVITLQASKTWMNYRMDRHFDYLYRCIERCQHVLKIMKPSYVRIDVMYKGSKVYLMEYNPVSDLRYTFKDMSDANRDQYIKF